MIKAISVDGIKLFLDSKTKQGYVFRNGIRRIILNGKQLDILKNDTLLINGLRIVKEDMR